MPLRLTLASLLVVALAAGWLPARGDETPVALPAVPLDPAVSAMLAKIDPNELRRIDTRLVTFGTRNTFSEIGRDPHRGVFAARDWIAGRFRDIARSSNGRMTVALDTYVQPKTDRTPRDVTVSSVYATLAGDDPTRATYVMSSHYDSRNSDGNDAVLAAPGADDNGSAVSAVLEAARVMAPLHFRGTIVFACFDGEEQGLFGSANFAKMLAARGVTVDADLNDDIIGASAGHDGEQAPYEVRVFSEALPAGADPQRVDLIGSENDSPARELARYAKEIGEAYVAPMHADLIYRSDRFLRGGDQQSFAAQGDPAIRFVEPHENFDHQHQTVRVENGVQYGDLLLYLDFDYLARVTRFNVSVLATLALAPAAPAPKMSTKQLGYSTSLYWSAVPDAAAYEVVWRATDEPVWTHGEIVTATGVTLPLSKDDWLFGVRSLDAAGHSSVVAFPVPVR